MSIPIDQARLIVQQVGDTEDHLVQQLIGPIWDSYADYGAVHPRLQRLYTQLECLDLLLGKLREEVDAGLGVDLDEKSSQKVANLQAQRAACLAHIAQVEATLRAQRVPAQASLTTTAIARPPTLSDLVILGPPDGNDSRYRGDVYKPLRRPLT